MSFFLHVETLHDDLPILLFRIGKILNPIFLFQQYFSITVKNLFYENKLEF